MKPTVEVSTGQQVLAGPAAAYVPRRSAGALRLLSDDRLARLAAKGERAAFAAIFDRYHQNLYRYCTSLLRNPEDASDALQNTMLRALEALEKDTREIALRPWLYRIAHNESISLLRRRPRETEAGEWSGGVTGDVEADAEVRARLRQLLDDIRELPDRQSGPLVMRELGGLDYAEIALAFGVSNAAVKQSVYEARCALHELADGRDMNCEDVRRRLSDGDRRSLRARIVRSHMRACAECSDFEAGMVARQWQLRAVTPALPAATASTLLHGVFASAGGGGSGGGLLALIGTSLGAKAITGLALAAGVGVGAATVAVTSQHSPRTSHATSRAPVAGGAGPARAHVGLTGARAPTVRPGATVTHAPAAAGGGRGAVDVHARPAAVGALDPGGHSHRNSPGGGAPGGGQAEGGNGAPQQPRERPVKRIRQSIPQTVHGVRPSLPVRPPSLPVHVHLPAPVQVHVPAPPTVSVPNPVQGVRGALPPSVSGLGSHP